VVVKENRTAGITLEEAVLHGEGSRETSRGRHTCRGRAIEFQAQRRFRLSEAKPPQLLK